MKFSKLASTSVLALVIALPVFAQTALTGVEAVDDRIDQIQEDAQDALNKGDDSERFGPTGVIQGWKGSLAATGSATSGNTKTSDLSVAARLTYGVGDWSHSFGIASEFASSSNTRSKEKLFATYEASRYFTPEAYAFGTARLEHDKFATNKKDSFVGFGGGYRIVNTDDVTWRVQAGPGYRFIEASTGAKSDEAALLASSRVFYAVSDTVSLTNDTDVLGSKANTIATNDFGMNFKVSDTMSTRVSYRTEYNSDPLPGLKSSDNTLGFAVVVGF